MADEARDPHLSDVPTTGESGFPKLQAAFWIGLVVPAGTPPSIIQRLNTEINAIMKSKEMEALLTKLSATSNVGSPDDFSAFIAAETQKWAPIVKAASIKVD